jgi:hypothetical protein
MHLPTAATLLLLLALPVLAQDATPAPSATVSPETTPASSPSPTASPADAPSASPEASASPSPDASPEASPSDIATSSADAAASPTPGEDSIPLPPESGISDEPIVSETDVPALDPASSDAAFADPNAFIPDSAMPEIPPAPAGPSAEEMRRKLKVRYEEVRIQVDKDPAVRSLKEQAQNAKTFEDERAAYREYYRLLFKKMRAVDKDLKDRCDAMESAYLGLLSQVRVEPTIPLNLPPKPEPLAE